MLPARMTPTELAELWCLTAARVRQFIRAGDLKKGEDGKVDTQEALAFRQVRTATFRGQVLEQSYGNRYASGDRAAPPKAALMPDDPLYLPPDTDDPLYLPPDPEKAVPVEFAPAMSGDQMYARTNRLADLRARKLEVELERQELRRQREAGELISRADVHKSAIKVGKLVANILRNLPGELAALFADPETRSEVRSKVQLRVDQVQAKLYRAAKNSETSDDDDDDL